ncbi:MAG TPA: hypothetical protein VFB77_13410 [Acidimicrobiales bacterium]|nr:hypothetical protein [Acidimicrobiales bacterium]
MSGWTRAVDLRTEVLDHRRDRLGRATSAVRPGPGPAGVAGIEPR